MLVTTQQICAIDRNIRSTTVEKYIEDLNSALDFFDLNTVPRITTFLAQCLHESAFFENTAENLNYSAEGLMKTFNTSKNIRFPNLAFAQKYARQPQKIANYVYANRNGNGGPDSGDGWRFRGQGLIQLTFRNTYLAYSGYMEDPTIMDNPSQLQLPFDACFSACWFVAEYKSLISLMDQFTPSSFEQISFRVNGGWRGKGERNLLWTSAKRVFS